MKRSEMILKSCEDYEKKFAGKKEGQFYVGEVVALVNAAKDENDHIDIYGVVTLALEAGYMKGYRNGRKTGYQKCLQDREKAEKRNKQ